MGRNAVGMSGRFIFFMLWKSRNAELTYLSFLLPIYFFNLYGIHYFRSDTSAAFKQAAQLTDKILHVFNSRELSLE